MSKRLNLWSSNLISGLLTFLPGPLQSLRSGLASALPLRARSPACKEVKQVIRAYNSISIKIRRATRVRAPCSEQIKQISSTDVAIAVEILITGWSSRSYCHNHYRFRRTWLKQANVYSLGSWRRISFVSEVVNRTPAYRIGIYVFFKGLRFPGHL